MVLHLVDENCGGGAGRERELLVDDHVSPKGDHVEHPEGPMQLWRSLVIYRALFSLMRKNLYGFWCNKISKGKP